MADAAGHQTLLGGRIGDVITNQTLRWVGFIVTLLTRRP
jgi:hypothetical protein